MNVKLLRRIQRKILELAESPKTKPLFDMRHFTGYSRCGTSHCIGGWAREMTGKPIKVALDVYGEEASRLFYCDLWPKKFQGRKEPYLPTPKQAVARIDHFIATNGAE
jgi:hypothetical protein